MKNKRYTNINIFDNWSRLSLARLSNWILLFGSIAFTSFPVAAQNKKPEPPKAIFRDKDGKLQYNQDSLGNRVPDFSHSGYMGGNEPIPNAEIKVVINAPLGDATQKIQSAIDMVAKLPLGQNGLRGVILLRNGTFHVSGVLKMNASGVVLRGSGMGTGGTLILASGLDRLGVIRVSGQNDRKTEQELAVIDQYVPVNAYKINISKANNFKIGDQILIRRPSTKDWISTLGTDHFGGGITALGWKPGQRDIYWDRVVTNVDANYITFDAPITTALDARYGGGFVSRYTWQGRISKVGIENLKIQSTYDKSNPKDEYHRWNAICLENTQDAWVRQVVFEHFAGSAVNILETAKRITVEDCKSLAPISEIGGERRNTFLTTGQQTLFQRIYAEYGFHDFAVGFCAAGPNAFVQCESYLPYGFSGAIDSWASGTLFDIVNVDGQALSYMNRWQDGQGAGWAAANSVFWQCSAARIDNYQPPTAQNWAFGTWAQFAGNGYWDMSNEQIQPRSLYYAQLKDRIGNAAESRTVLLPMDTEASSSPPVDVAMKLTKLAAKPLQTLVQFIDKAPQRNPLPTHTTLKSMSDLNIVEKIVSKPSIAMKVTNGLLVRGNKLVLGNTQDVQWWSGSARPYALKASKPHITRFVPGRSGRGLTDDLDSLTENMKNGSVKIIDHNYGLWYDRRRDDHERIRRMDGDVWAPFYELPFARSGQGLAWDGLSKYDLSKYNLWYWDRLKQFADLADQKGLVLIHENYFQHNIIEAGAHYADFPWRTANNINDTGFPEPVPYAGDKRIFMAEQFYDISNPQRRKIHTAYIRKCLDNFASNSSVIQLISSEFTGPLHFVQFWIDIIKQWEKETGKHPIIGISATKDVQDAILADPARASVVDVIDIKYWHFQADGTTYEPKGGQNLAPRQHARLLKPKPSSFKEVYKAVSTYRSKYPQKAVIYSGDGSDKFPWAILMAGGSLAGLTGVNDEIVELVAKMRPVLAVKSDQYLLAGAKEAILYNASSVAATLDLQNDNSNFAVKIINPKTGETLKTAQITGGNMVEIAKVSNGDELLILKKL